MEGSHFAANSSNSLNRAFTLGITINVIYVIVEATAGIYYSSLSLISDAGHNLSDVAALGLAMLAFRLSKIKANNRFTYGYRKSTILVSLVNSIILFIAIGGILWESVGRVLHPVAVYGQAISIVAGIGIVVNAVSALLFFKNKDHDLNVKGAYLHLMADAAVSLGVVVSGICISLFKIHWLDTATSFAVVIVIFYSTWQLFRESLYLTIDAVPRGIDLTKITNLILRVDGVESVQHLHVWALSTTQNALTTNVAIRCSNVNQQSEIKQAIKKSLLKNNIQHITIEFELSDNGESEISCGYPAENS